MWNEILGKLDSETRALRVRVDQFLTHGETTGLNEALTRTLALIPRDVLDRPQHPLTVTSKALAGALRQAQEGHTLLGAGDTPEWWTLLIDGVNEAMDDFERELAILLSAEAEKH